MTPPDLPPEQKAVPAPSWAITPTVPAAFLTDLLAGKSVVFLRRLGIGAAMLKDAGFRITPLQFSAALREVVREDDDELFGLYARPVPRGLYARMLRLQTYCPTVRAALEEGAALYGLFDGAPPWRIVTTDKADEIRLTLRTERQSASVLYSHLMLLSLWHTASWLAGITLPLRDVLLPRACHDFTPESRFLFGRAPRYGQAARLMLPRGSLTAAVMRRPDDTRDFLRRTLLAMIGPGPQGSLETRLRRLLAASQPFAALKESAAAAALSMSRQTLAKRLATLGTSFQDIREELRRDRACALLSRSGLSFAEIAEQLGYSEPSAFQRAFKHWTGLPPGLYRRRIGAVPDGKPS